MVRSSAVLVVALVLCGCGTARPEVGATPSAVNEPTHSSSVTASPTPVASLDCPTTVPAHDRRTATTVPAGAVALRWCAPVQDAPERRWAPVDVVTSGVDDWITAFNARPALRPDAVCTADLTTTEGAVLLYPDGHTESVWGMAAGCRTLGGRTGFVALRQQALDLVQQQRRSGRLPTASPQPCADQSSLLTPRPADLVRGWACPAGGKAVPLDAGQLDALRAALPAPAAEGSTVDQTVASGRGRVQLAAASGDFLVLAPSTTAGGWLLLDGRGRPATAWKPTGPAAQLLAGLLP
ncbi:hypothetical protein [Luteococcus peritonei]|uniref:DUF3558 domain-containing protein n=1 Tax=Luteococcus peritonei TaxID=88874 RepID=A0ABW4RVR7_9ACTN